MIDYEIQNKTITKILCCLFGWAGLHHFYNKHVKMGLLYLCTFGMLTCFWMKDIAQLFNIPGSNKFPNE